MHEVAQHAEIEVHPDLVQDRLETSVKRLTVLAYHQGTPDGTQALGRIGGRSREDVVWLRGHVGLLCRRAYRSGPTIRVACAATRRARTRTSIRAHIGSEPAGGQGRGRTTDLPHFRRR